MQHIALKLFAAPPAAIRLQDAIPVFHRWIQTSAVPGLLIDVADYSHVPAGPGVLLIAHEFTLGLDQSRNRLGLLYTRKAPLAGGALENLLSVWEAAASAARRLESEPEFAGRLRFTSGEIQVILNDRLLYPNTDETWDRFAAAFQRFFDHVFAGADYVLARPDDPRERFTLTASAPPPAG